jgi:hypothetical protein
MPSLSVRNLMGIWRGYAAVNWQPLFAFLALVPYWNSLTCKAQNRPPEKNRSYPKAERLRFQGDALGRQQEGDAPSKRPKTLLSNSLSANHIRIATLVQKAVRMCPYPSPYVPL